MIPLLSAGAVSILVAGFGTPILLRWLIRWRIGQQIRVDGPAHHTVKAGTPTMGGIAILVAVVAGYFLGHVGTSAPFTRPAWLVLGAIVVAGAVGAADDWIKVSRRRSLGLNKRWKTMGLVLVAVLFCVADVRWGGVHTTLSFTRYDLPGVELGAVGWVIWGTVIIFGTANSVNLTTASTGSRQGPRPSCAGSSPWSDSCSTGTRASTECTARSTSPWLRCRWAAPVSAFCGGTQRRPGSSWVTQARWP